MEKSKAPDIEISSLPDEIIRRILIATDLDLKSSAETVLISHQLCNLWKSSITKLHFHMQNPNHHHKWNNFSQFVEKLLSIQSNGAYPNDDLDLLSLSTDGMLFLKMFDLLHKIFTHGVVNRAQTFRLAAGLNRLINPVPPSLTALCVSVENLELSIFADLQVMRASMIHNCLVLIMVPGLVEIEDSPFKSMDCVEFHNCGNLISNRRVFNALISYFFDDCIQGRTALFDRIPAQLGSDSGDGNRRFEPVVVYKSDLVSSRRD
ncbi:hypothetical protein LINGRAHAP2_LOCUS340 [Linum grandiflorum]